MPTRLFEIDLHVHAGNERYEASIADFLAALHARGVTLCGLLDHVELHLMLDNWSRALRKQLDERNLPYYRSGIGGLQDLYRDIDAAARPGGMRVLKGLEFNNTAATPDEALALPDFLCFCFGDVSNRPGATYGERAADQIRQVGRKILPSGKAGIINHPFRQRLWAYKDLCARHEAPPVAQFISEDDVRRMAEAAGEYDLALEINLGDLFLLIGSTPEHAALRALWLHAAGTLVASGASLSLGSDSHKLPGPFEPAILDLVAAIGLEVRHLERILNRLIS